MFKWYRASREFSATAGPLVSCETQRKLMVVRQEEKGVLLSNRHHLFCSRNRCTMNKIHATDTEQHINIIPKNRLRLAKVIVKNKMSRFLWFTVYKTWVEREWWKMSVVTMKMWRWWRTDRRLLTHWYFLLLLLTVSITSHFGRVTWRHNVIPYTAEMTLQLKSAWSWPFNVC